MAAEILNMINDRGKSDQDINAALDALPGGTNLDRVFSKAVAWNRTGVVLHLLNVKRMSPDTMYDDMSMLALAMLQDDGNGTHTDIIRELLGRCTRSIFENPADLHVGDFPGATLLIFAVLANQPVEIIDRILARSMDLVNQKNFVGKTALHYAAILNKFDVAQLLVRAGANPNVKDKKGATPFSSTGDLRIRDLLNPGPDPGSPERPSAVSSAIASLGAGSPPGQVAPKSPSDLLDPQPPPSPQGGRRRTRRTRSKRKKTRGRRRS
jgi:ankyrin repeat protein